jgi:hypothetical protein
MLFHDNHVARFAPPESDDEGVVLSGLSKHSNQSLDRLLFFYSCQVVIEWLISAALQE